MKSPTIGEAALARVTLTEIASQPEMWLRAASLASQNLVGMPEKGEHVLVIGCGTSFYVASAYAWLREQSGGGVSDAVIASEWPPITRHYDRVVVISRSGASAEALQAVERVETGVPVTGVLGDLDTSIARVVTHVVDLSFADESSVVQTRFPTTVLTLMRSHLGITSDAEITLLAQAAERAICAGATEPLPGQIVILGSGWAAHVAQEAALKCRESVGMWAEAYATGEYRHGPIGAASSRTLVWALSPLTPAQADSIHATGARLKLAVDDPQVELVKIQAHAAAWATQVGRSPDLPAHLSRSVSAL